tara:strand:- start:1054 stop:1359 length:306 start_codon:yes stop_codon:yes gene_type:complete
MSLSEKIQRIKIKNIDPSGRTPLLDMVNQQIKGKVNDAGEEIKQVQCQCRGGFCGMCKIKVVDGEYVMHDHAIKELCMDDTETLACSTKVISDEIEIELNI